MARPKKKKPAKKSAAPVKRKSRLPDIISGRFIVTQNGNILDSGGVICVRPEKPWVFQSRTHALAYISEKSIPATVEKLSAYYGIRYEITDGDADHDRVVCMLVPKEQAKSFKQAVKERLAITHNLAIAECFEQIKDLDIVHKKDIAERIKAYTERRRDYQKVLSAAEKQRKTFINAMKKLGGL